MMILGFRGLRVVWGLSGMQGGNNHILVPPLTHTDTQKVKLQPFCFTVIWETNTVLHTMEYGYEFIADVNGWKETPRYENHIPRHS